MCKQFSTIRVAAAAICLLAAGLSAKDQPIVLVWPDSGTPVLRFTFGKMQQVGATAGNNSFAMEVAAENVWSKPISSASFDIYFFDKNKVRIGNGYLDLMKIPPNQAVKFTCNFLTRGTPVSFQISPRDLPPELQPAAPPKTISMTVYSVPPGATLAVDGKEAGQTPKQIQLTPGKHTLEFSKEGFHRGTFPLEVGANDVSGGNVTYELGGLAHDTIELRDGTVLTADLESVTATTVELRIGGKLQSFERNQVKRILLVSREAPQQ